MMTTKTITSSLAAFSMVLGLALPAIAQDPVLSGLPLSLSGEPESTLQQRGQRAPAKKDHQFAIIASVESWRSEMDTSSESAIVVSDAFVLHSATIISFDYKNNSIANMTIGGHAGIGFENVGVDVDVAGGGIADEVMEGGFIFELGGGFRSTFAGSKWDIGGDLLLRFGDHDGTVSDYEYQMFRLTAEGGYQIAPEVRLFAKLRFNGLYEGEMDYTGPADFETEIDQPIGVSAGADFTVGSILAAFELMLLDVEDFGFAASVGWKF